MTAPVQFRPDAIGALRGAAIVTGVVGAVIGMMRTLSDGPVDWGRIVFGALIAGLVFGVAQWLMARHQVWTLTDRALSDMRSQTIPLRDVVRVKTSITGDVTVMGPDTAIALRSLPRPTRAAEQITAAIRTARHD
ncbi:hypothetical protein [Paracoccus sp. (in: a-proteobacteria)]|uniref:hypothetical protein n=1 Tax=Paracoccus sp. TaxID=267 RepID=UPI0026DEF91D|nr:hypothetical protein [Paracoccus sp. (in: a-proteobacteria)]MDO5648477.1 hypothetical protein [Paracoccus sp. (in: a-proteobacteria)]